MKRTPQAATFLALTALAPGIAARPALAQSSLRIIGGLSNFDCYNDTEIECEGFDVEIGGNHKEDVMHAWAYSAFGAPTVEDGGTAAPSHCAYPLSFPRRLAAAGGGHALRRLAENVSVAGSASLSLAAQRQRGG